jgi:NADPH:quinone reductase-like Zn-dependent oxidoreductase
MCRVPVRKPGWVRIRVKVFGVNESEVTTRAGESDAVVTYPRVPGIEGVGVVDDADQGSELRPGQQVATMMGGMGRSPRLSPQETSRGSATRSATSSRPSTETQPETTGIVTQGEVGGRSWPRRPRRRPG